MTISFGTAFYDDNEYNEVVGARQHAIESDCDTDENGAVFEPFVPGKRDKAAKARDIECSSFCISHIISQNT